MRQFVLDCNVTMAWCFEDEEDQRAEALLNNIKPGAVHVPCVWMLEVANVFLVAERRGRLDEDRARELLDRITRLRVEQESIPDSSAIARILALARRYDLSAYDAAYLELAIRLDMPLATLDARLSAAAEKAGVKPAL